MILKYQSLFITPNDFMRLRFSKNINHFQTAEVKSGSNIKWKPSINTWIKYHWSSKCMTYNCRELREYRVRREKKYSFWQLYSCKSHKDNWKDPGRLPGDPASKSCPIGENWGIYPSYPEGKGVKTFRCLLNYNKGKKTEPGQYTAILWFTPGTCQGKEN